LLYASFTDGEQQYKLNVIGGEGTGEYERGVPIHIKANPPQPGYKFDKWVVTDPFGNIVHITNDKNLDTSILLTSSDLTATATYVKLPDPVPTASDLPTSNVVKLYTPIQKRIGVKAHTTIKIPIIAYGKSNGSSDKFSVKYTVSNKKTVKITKKFNSQTVNKAFYIKLKGLKTGKSTIKIKTGGKQVTLKVFTTATNRRAIFTKTGKVNKKIVNVSILKKAINSGANTYVKVYEKNIARYNFPVYKFDKKFVHVDKFGRVYALKKTKKTVITTKWLGVKFKVSLRIK
jgi:hypothetical protein